MATKKTNMAFKPCAGCPSAAKCKSMGQCMKQEKTEKMGKGYAKGGMVLVKGKNC